MSRLMLGLLFAVLGSFCFFGNLQACRAVTRRSYRERMAEIDDLLRSGLITAQEYEGIRQEIEHESVPKIQKAKT